MGLRSRKLVGSLILFIWLVVFSLIAMAIIARFDRPHILVEMGIYAVLGFAWILPLKPVFVWMGKAPRPDPIPPPAEE
jgi:hypothetical protein